MAANINKAIIYQSKSGEIKLRGDFDRNTICAIQNQIVDVFSIGVRTISEHFKNIYKTQKLQESATIRKFRIIQKEGNRSISREVNFYNLDAIILVGYRVNSKRAAQFRIWATKILKQYITQDYTINKKVLYKNYNAFLKKTINIIKFITKGMMDDFIFSLPKEKIYDNLKEIDKVYLKIYFNQSQIQYLKV